MKEKKLNIEGMNCHHCVMAVENELKELGIDLLDVKIGTADIKYDETKISDDDIAKAIDEAGFKLVN